MPKILYEASGKRQSLQDWGKELDVKWQTLWSRIKKGIPVEQALSPNFVKSHRPKEPENRIDKKCENCGSVFSIPKCRDFREHSCSGKCKAEVREKKKLALKLQRKRNCLYCSREFVAKKSQIDAGHAKYCSLICSFEHQGRTVFHNEDARERASKSRKESFEMGLFTHKAGPDHPMWTGGPEAARKRRIDSGESARYIRQYRKNHPEKVRAYSQKRRFGKIEKLPKGTVKRIGMLQRWMCAICKCDAKNDFHLDHIQPLSKGGMHEPKNLQILCPKCNMKKSAKNPEEYMQSLGFLL